jgi:hypothetical protein
MRRLRILLVLAAAIAALLTIAPAPSSAAGRHDNYPLHAGSSGQRISDLQWLLAGHRPNAFTKVKPTFNHRPNGWYGARTKSAVKAYKFRVGYPAKGQCGAKKSAVTDTAGRYFIELLEGHVQRPICWVAVAQHRLQIVEPGVTPLALKIKAWEISQLGNHETSWNCGPTINGYFTYLHLPCGLAWCEIFQANAFGRSGYLPIPFALGAASPYGVISTEQWARALGYLNAKVRVGSLVAFLDDGGHIGFVIRVTAAGYVTIEGNAGDAVREVWHAWNDRLRVFIDLPGVA